MIDPKTFKERPEAAIQFDDIWDKFNDPDEAEKRKYIRIREERAEEIRQDLGI